MFSFDLLDTEDRVIQTASNDIMGHVAFADIEYAPEDNGTEKTYKIRESLEDRKAWFEYDDTVCTVSVRISNKGETEVSYTYGEEELGDNDVPVFTNIYTARGQAVIHAKKKMEGKPLDEGAFSFSLTNDNDEEVGHASNDIDGNISFTLDYTLADLGVHSYTISEVIDDGNEPQPAVVYDTHEETLSVNVLDGGNGALIAIVDYNGVFDGDCPVFTNSYEPKGTISLDAEKVLEGPAVLEAGQFSFEVRDEDGRLIANASNDAEGHIAFDAIELFREDIGTKHYTIAEVEGDNDRIAYDSHTCYVTAIITDDGGTLKGNTSYSWQKPGEPEGEHPETAPNTFTNTYKLMGGVKIKKVNDEGEPLENVTFNIHSSSTGHFYEAITTGPTGIAETAPDSLPEGGYFLVEKEAPDGYCTDFAKKEFTIDHEGLVDLSGEPIVNHKKTGSALIKIKKEFRNGDLKPGQFTFELVNGGQVIATAVNDAEGNVSFELGYTVDDIGKLFTYTIREVAGNDPNIEYDGEEYDVAVAVSEKPRELACTVAYGADADELAASM